MSAQPQAGGAVVLFPTADRAKSAIHESFENQRAAFDRFGAPSYSERRVSLTVLLAIVERSRTLLADALNEDFGGRAFHESQMVDINGTINSIRYLRRNLRRWMRAERRGTSIWFLPGGNKVVRQPLGVVGVISPWNYPVHLTLAPVAAALAAGNRVMVKMSEAVPQTTALLKRLRNRRY